MGGAQRRKGQNARRMTSIPNVERVVEVVSLNSQIEDGEGNSIELIDTIADVILG
jgi:hypothetical protein